MSIQFSRSMRSLKVDSYRASLVGILLASVILLVLVVWFFTAHITLYEVSTSLSLTEDGLLMARFPAESMARIRPGQAAIVRLTVGSDQSVVSLPAVVFDVEPGSNDVEIAITADDVPENLLSGGIKGQVDVEADYVTPSTLVMRAMGKYLTRPQLSTSPQGEPGAP